MGVAQSKNLGGGGGGHMPLVPPWFLHLCILELSDSVHCCLHSRCSLPIFPIKVEHFMGDFGNITRQASEGLIGTS